MAPGETLVLGIDLGTTHVKCAVIQCNRSGSQQWQVISTVQKAVGSFRQPHLIDENTSNTHQQDPAAFVGSLCRCLHELPSELRRSVERIAITCQMHGIVLWRQDNMACCTPLVTWRFVPLRVELCVYVVMITSMVEIGGAVNSFSTN